MKKNMIVIVALLCAFLVLLSGCGGAKNEDVGMKTEEFAAAEVTRETEAADAGDSAAEADTTSEGEPNSAGNAEVQVAQDQEFQWPSEASDLDVTEVGKGNITSTWVTEEEAGLKIIVGYSELNAQDIEAYRETILNKGFRLSDKYGMEGIWNYEKKTDNGLVGVQVMSSGNDATIMITSADSGGKDSNAGFGIETWSDKIPKDVPVFTKGTLSSTSELAGMHVLEFKDVHENDAEAYKKELLDNGFLFEDEMYFKIQMAISVLW